MPRILHLGVGNFFRAHLADYTQATPDWRITGVSFRSPNIRDGLEKQGYAYALVIRGADGTEVKRITALQEMIVVPEDPVMLLYEIADPDVAVISLTITEKGYHLGADGRLDLSDPAVAADLQGAAMTPVGALARGLAQRDAPVTVLSCDNLPNNGGKLAAAVTRFADAAGLPAPRDTSFPACMVDRITPGTTDDVRAQAGDPMAVPTEAFTEWVIEDNFAAARPDWPGVQWVGDVAPHEMRKLRMLNGAHSFLAYAGVLKGFEFVHEAVADSELRAQARALMDEAAETLPDTVQRQADAYANALLARFDNPHMNHRLRQIAMDGSQKIPIRILDTLADRGDRRSPALERAVAVWVGFVRQEVAAGRTLEDPAAEALVTACAGNNPDQALRDLLQQDQG